MEILSKGKAVLKQFSDIQMAASPPLLFYSIPNIPNFQTMKWGKAVGKHPLLSLSWLEIGRLWLGT